MDREGARGLMLGFGEVQVMTKGSDGSFNHSIHVMGRQEGIRVSMKEWRDQWEFSYWHLLSYSPFFLWTRGSSEDLNGDLYCNRRHGWRFAIHFLLSAKFYRIPTDIALSHLAERVVLANIIGDPPTGLVDCSATLLEIAEELVDPLFGQLITFSVLPLASSHFGSLCGIVLLRKTNRRLTDCFFPRLLIHFLQGFPYWNVGRFFSFWRLANLNSAIRRIPFLVLF
uniref:Uncharacterized protein n=1 Tax=Solanum tuberosum TaxID=4113 RepID=M1DCQ6_SOLTU